MLLQAAAVLIVAAGAAMVDYLSKYGSCGEFTGVDNAHIANQEQQTQRDQSFERREKSTYLQGRLHIYIIERCPEAAPRPACGYTVSRRAFGWR